MAGRFVLQKVFSGVSRSGALGARGGASAAAAAERAAPKIQGYPSRAAHASQTFPSNRWIHGSATRNFDCSQVAAKPSSLTSRIPSVIINRVKPAKRTFSSTMFPTTEHEFAVRAKKREQEFAEWKAKFEAEHAKMAAEYADYERFWRHMKWLYGFAGLNILLGFFSDNQVKRTRNIKSQRKEWPNISSGWWD